MGFLDSLKEKAFEASEAVKEKATSATEVIVDTALKIKCATNWHAGEFKNEEGKPECFFSKVCPDCGEYITKSKHFFNEPPVIENPNRCYGYRVCELCGFKQSDYFIIMKEQIKTNNVLLLRDVVCVDMKDLVSQSINGYIIERVMLF